jgi:phosphoribosyl 1,2-cyclic phosphodiesterase
VEQRGGDDDRQARVTPATAGGIAVQSLSTRRDHVSRRLSGGCMSHDLVIHFHGVRGSIAAPGVSTARCRRQHELRRGDLRRRAASCSTPARACAKLGERLIAAGSSGDHHPPVAPPLGPHPGHAVLRPGVRADNWIEVVSGPNGVMPLEAALRRQMSAPFFPVDFEDVSRQLRVREPRLGERFAIGDVEVTMAKLNHPDPVFGYRLDVRGASVVYATDTEHFACVDPALVRLAHNADILIYDAQYTPEEYPGKVGWGHSTWEAAVALARAAGVRQLVLYHHDPRRADDQVAALEARAALALPGTIAAREGSSLRLETRATRRTEVAHAVVP